MSAPVLPAAPDYLGDRVALRRFRLPDAPFVVELHSSPDLVRFIPSAQMSAPQEAADWIVRTTAEEGDARGWWCVTTHDDTRLGAVVLKTIPPSDGRPGDEVEVGWRMHPDHTGHGYATEAARLLVDAGFSAGLDHIVAVVNPQNHASQAVCHRLGMTPLGRDDRYYDEMLEIFQVTPETLAGESN